MHEARFLGWLTTNSQNDKKAFPTSIIWRSLMMLLVITAVSVSAVIGFILYKLGFHIGKQMGQTQHIREHLEQTRTERQTIQSQQIG